MGVFSDYVIKYSELGLSCIPCKNDKKAPVFPGWQKYCDTLPSDDEIVSWSKQYDYIEKIGLCLGRASGVVAFDFDYAFDQTKTTKSADEFEKDQKMVERQILQMLPQTPCVKRGEKGWTRFYKWTPHLDENSNIFCDRNGVRLFDFLSWHKQTIIPPSIHSVNKDTGHLIRYVWIGASIEESFDDLPTIDLSIIEDIKATFCNKNNLEKSNGRHGELLPFLILTLKIQKDINVVAKMLVEKDKSLHKDNPYLSDKKHHSSEDAIKNATNWALRVSRWMSDKTFTNEVSKLSGIDQKTYFEFFKQVLPEHKVEKLSEAFLMKVSTEDSSGAISERWRPVENYIKSIRSDAVEVGLSRTYVEDHLSRYKDTLKPDFLFKIEKWDGIDRLEKIARLCPARNYVNSTDPDEYEHQISCYTSMLKHTAAGILRRAYDSEEQNESPVLRGPQGVGKNHFIINVYGKPFTQHYWSEITVTQDQQKNYDAVDGKLVVIIGEFDQASKVQISFIKELLTNSGYSSRRAYDRRSDRYTLHHTMFSASNFESVLKDTSGNRRFNIYDFDHINWEYINYCQPEQLLAQYYELYLKGYKMTQDARNMVNAFIAGETPEDPIETAVAYYRDRFKKVLPLRQEEWIEGHLMVDFLKEVEIKTGVKNQWIRSRLKKLGISKKSKNGVLFKNLHMEK